MVFRSLGYLLVGGRAIGLNIKLKCTVSPVCCCLGEKYRISLWGFFQSFCLKIILGNTYYLIVAVSY